MSDQLKYVLDETQIPKTWYNLAADLPKPLPPVLHPGTKQPVGPADLEPLFPMALILQEVSAERTIDIPEPIRDVYRMWRPSPLIRARRLERALDTPAKIYYKYEGVSPAGSHKPNTAVPQAWYNKEQGVTRLSTETGAGQWGSALAFAGSLFGLEVTVFHGPRLLRPEALSPRADGDLWRALRCLAVEGDRFRPRDPRQGPRQPGLARHRHLRGGGDGGQGPGGEILARLGAQPRAAASDRHRAGGDQAARDGGRRPRRGDRLHRRRLELRRARLPVPRPAAARRAQAPHHRGRAGGVPVADARQIRLRLRRHRAPDAARQDAHARLDLHPAGLPRRRAALSRHGADGVAHLTSSA